jgi:hypothetical protein
MLVRSPNADFGIVDLTSAVRNIPISYGTFNNIGIFSEESVASEAVIFEETTVDGALIVDRVRGEKNLVSKQGTRKLHSFVVPHFPQDDYISPMDLQSISAYDNFDVVERLESVRMEKLARLRMNHDWTLNKARAQALFSATAYAPNGTVVQNWNTEFGVTRDDVDFTLGTATTEMLEKLELVIQLTQDAMAQSAAYSGIILPCGSTFFSRFISHATVKDAYKSYINNQVGLDPIRGRLSAGGSPMQNGREFYFGGVTLREVRDTYNGTAIAPAAEGVSVPTGSNTFKTYFAPAQRFGLVNTLGEKLYVFEEAASNNTKITLESEANHISALLRPKAVIRIHTSN